MFTTLREHATAFEVAPGWVVVDPPSRFPGPIDHVVIGRGGVLAVARWSGDVTVVGDVLHQNGRRRELQATDLVRETDALAGLLRKEHRDAVAPVIVTRGDHPPIKIAPGLVLIGTQALAPTLEKLPAHLGPDDIADVLGRIAQARARRADELPTQATLSAVLDADRARRH